LPKRVPKAASDAAEPSALITKLQNSKQGANSSKFLQWTDVLKGEESSEGMDFLGNGISKEAEDPQSMKRPSAFGLPVSEDRADVGLDWTGFA